MLRVVIVQVFHPDASNKQRQDNNTSVTEDDDEDDADPEALLCTWTVFFLVVTLHLTD